MTAADKIAEARALIEPLTGHTPGPWISKESKWSEEQIVQAGMPSNRVLARFDGDGEGADEQSLSDARLMAAAPALRDTAAALADLADAQAQEIAKLRDAARDAIEIIKDSWGEDQIEAGDDQACNVLMAALGETP